MFRSARPEAAKADNADSGARDRPFAVRSKGAPAGGGFRAGIGPSAEDIRRAVGETSPVGAKLAEQIAGEDEAAATPDTHQQVDEEQVRAEGFAAGRKAAELALNAELDAARLLIAKLENAFAGQLDIDSELVAPDLSRLALAISVAIAGELPTQLPETISVRVEEALGQFKKERTPPVLYINPDDMDFFSADGSRFELLADKEIARGDFRMTNGDAELIDTIADRVAAAGDWLK